MLDVFPLSKILSYFKVFYKVLLYAEFMITHSENILKHPFYKIVKVTESFRLFLFRAATAAR